MRSAGMPGPGLACNSRMSAIGPQVAHTTWWLTGEPHTEWLYWIGGPSGAEVVGARTATVTLTLRDGRLISRHVDVVRGTVEDPMSAPELVDKALDLLVPVLGAARSQEVVRRLLDLAELPDVRALGALLSPT